MFRSKIIQVQDNIDNNYNNIVYGEIDESRIDYSPLTNIDPDINFIMSNKQLDWKYYTESEFNHTFHVLNMFLYVSCKYSEHTTEYN